ncbi:MAG: MFS transporter, partial [Nitrososphaerales archaeon]
MEYKWTVFGVTSIGVLMSAIDGQIIIVGLPQVARALHADVEQAIWFTQSYVFVSTVTLLFIGKITDTIGRVKIYTIGFVIFTIGSALTSVSMNPEQLILFRGVQGLGSAMLTVNSAALLIDAAGGRNIGFFMGLNAFNVRGGSILGLTLSGVILSFLDWRYLFYINIPIGILGTYLAYKLLKETHTYGKRPPMDWIGFGAFTTAIAFLLLGLTFSAYGQANFSITVLLSFLAAASFAIFLVQETRFSNPMVDLKLFRIRAFAGSSLAILFNSVSWGAVLLLLSLYLQLVRGFSPLQAGSILIPFQVAVLSVGPLSGRLSDRYGRVPFTVVGLLLQGSAVFLFSTLSSSTGTYSIIAYMLVFGFGTGMFNSPISSSIMESAPPDRRGIATATYNAFFAVGFTLSLNLSIIIMTSTIPYQVISSLLATGTSSGSSQINGILFGEAISRAYLFLAA